MRNPQFNRHGALSHLITTEGLPARILSQLLDQTDHFLSLGQETVSSDVPLAGRRVFSLLEALSANMRDSFCRAATQLGAEHVHVDVQALLGGSPDALLNSLSELSIRRGDLLVMQQRHSGAPYLIAQHIAPDVHVVNAGDGAHADPTGALAHMNTIRRHKQNFADLIVTIVGDIRDSGLARSCIHALTTLCVAEVRVVAPLTLLPMGLEKMGVRCLTDLAQGVREADVIIILPTRDELTPSSLRATSRECTKLMCLSQETRAYAKPDCLVLDERLPEYAAVLQAVRMAVMHNLTGASQ